jgi:hypothetical protein
MGAFLYPYHPTHTRMSIYSGFLSDLQAILSDIGIPATVNGNLFLVGLSQPMNTPKFDAGGFVDQKMWTVRFAAATAPWTASDGRVGGQVATIVSNVPAAFLAEGKKLTVNGQVLRIKAQAYKQASAVIELQCIDDNQ